VEIKCPQCEKSLGTVTSVARLLLTVHCPFDGNDFGVAVDAPEQIALPTPETPAPAPVTT
jgi:hypothetical protein